jgi:hypothetical protein
VGLIRPVFPFVGLLELPLQEIDLPLFFLDLMSALSCAFADITLAKEATVVFFDSAVALI